MQIKKVLRSVLKIILLIAGFILLFLFSLLMNSIMAQQSHFCENCHKNIQLIRQSELKKENYDIENWVIYDEDEKFLYLCKGDMYGFGVKFLLFKITNGFFFGEKIEKKQLNF